MKLKGFVTPLSFLSVIALMYGTFCIIFSDNHGWLAISGLLMILFVCIPSFILSLLINIFIHNKNLKIAVQVGVSIAIITVHYYRFGDFAVFQTYIKFLQDVA
jgi:hypothetical protein